MRQPLLRSCAAVAAFCGLLAFAPAALADVVTIAPNKDNTLYESATGSLSNGAGEHFFVGRTDVISGGAIRRGVIALTWPPRSRPARSLPGSI